MESVNKRGDLEVKQMTIGEFAALGCVPGSILWLQLSWFSIPMSTPIICTIAMIRSDRIKKMSKCHADVAFHGTGQSSPYSLRSSLRFTPIDGGHSVVDYDYHKQPQDCPNCPACNTKVKCLSAQIMLSMPVWLVQLTSGTGGVQGRRTRTKNFRMRLYVTKD